MANIITKRNDVVYVECACCCSIISIFNLDKDRWYIQHYGQSEDSQADFEMNTSDFEAFLAAISAIVDNNKYATNHIEEQAAVIYSEKYKECISITVDDIGCVGILKYHKNFKKFMRHHSRLALNNSTEVVPYTKCKCDWEVLIEHYQLVALDYTLNRLYDLVKLSEATNENN